MWCGWLLLAWAAVAAAAPSVYNVKAVVFPSSYSAVYTFTLPYMRKLQSGGLTYTVKVWYDKGPNRLRIDSYDGMQSAIANGNVEYTVTPVGNKMTCATWNDGSSTSREDGPVAEGSQEWVVPVKAPLPDLATGWKLAGTTTLGAVLGSQGPRGASDAAAAPSAARAPLWASVDDSLPVHRWTLGMGPTGAPGNYSFYVTGAGVPVRLHMLGTSLLDGNHLDDYVIDFQQFKAGPPPASAFGAPKGLKCDKYGSEAAPAGPVTLGRWQRRRTQMHSLLPWQPLSGPHPAGSPHHEHGDEVGYAVRKAMATVANWNASATGYEVAMTHLAGLSWEEYSATVLGLLPAPAGEAASDFMTEALLGTFVPTTPPSKLPKQVDWSHTPASPVVKDQAVCGSCWAYSTISTIEAAHYLTTGKQITLSEQQMMDCANVAGVGCNGCAGGQIEPAFAWAVKHSGGGLVAARDHRYYGQDMLCAANATRPGAPAAARVKGFITVPPGNNTALMEALWKHGPLSVAMDAGQPTFPLYARGVYYDRWCYQEVGMLNHAVTLVGYGSDPGGKDFWILRNSWTSMWGEAGYFRIARRGALGGRLTTDCGVSAQPILAVVDAPAGTPSVRKHVLVYKDTSGKVRTLR